MLTAKRLKKSEWNTYFTSAYTHDVANDQASAGGVHLYEIRKRGKFWQKRIYQSNGRHGASGPVTSVDEEEGESLFATAEEC